MTMKFQKGGYILERSTQFEGNRANAFFIAANGYSGFRSRYDTVFSSQSFTHIYVIKGGPGTGKSRMMSEAARAVEEKGGTVEYIYCSSDPESLDGVILTSTNGRIALFDGTAPHTRCTDYPGVIDDIANLGEFWNSQCLADQRTEILRLCREKSSDYQTAYHYLSLAGAVDRLLDELLARCIDGPKIRKAVQRSLRELHHDATHCENIQYWNACSMRGKAYFSPVPNNATVIRVDNYLNSGRFYLNALRDALREAKTFSYVLIPSCYTDERTEGVYLPKDNLLFVSGDAHKGSKTINMKRFLKPDSLSRYRSQIRRLISLHESITDTAVSYLKEAGAFHFALEEIYGAAMDFEAKEQYVNQIIEKIIRQLFPAP